jgi:predicted amidohydrolase
MIDRCKGSDLIVLPEIWNIGFASFDRYHGESEPIDGPTASAVAGKARELGAYICSGSFIEARGGKLFNTAVLFDRDGKRIARYSKIHLFTHKSREPELLTPGSEIVVADTEFGGMALSICYDLRFPELYRKMADMGAEFFIVAASWPFPRLAPWEMFNTARAAENVCCLVSSNATGKQAGTLLMGHSKIVDPYGTVIAGADYHEAIVTADVDPKIVARVREEFPVLKDRVLK